MTDEANYGRGKGTALSVERLRFERDARMMKVKQKISGGFPASPAQSTSRSAHSSPLCITTESAIAAGCGASRRPLLLEFFKKVNAGWGTRLSGRYGDLTGANDAAGAGRGGARCGEEGQTGR